MAERPASKKQCCRKKRGIDVITAQGIEAGGHRDFMEEIAASGLAIPDYPIQNSLTAKLRALAQQRNLSALTNLWAGQSAAKAEAKPAVVISRDLIRQAEELV